MQDDIIRHKYSPIKPINFPEIKYRMKKQNSSHNYNYSAILNSNIKSDRPTSKKPSPAIILFEKYNTPDRSENYR